MNTRQDRSGVSEKEGIYVKRKGLQKEKGKMKAFLVLSF